MRARFFYVIQKYCLKFINLLAILSIMLAIANIAIANKIGGYYG